MYGADNNYFHYNGDQVEMVFMQPYYKEALKTYNDWYRSGLINPEMFAYKTCLLYTSYRGGLERVGVYHCRRHVR